MTTPQSISGLRETIERFDVYFLDQFGVLHDGVRPYPGVVEALEALHDAGKSLVILTNSGKRAASNLERLVAMGMPRATIYGVMSSGEVAWRRLRDGAFVDGAGRERKIAIIGRSGVDYGLGGLDLAFVATPDESDFLLILGSDAPKMSLDDYAELLRGAAARGVPALCANPDIWMLTPHGLCPAPGAIARTYQEIGGDVSYIGKPFGAIYEGGLGLCADVQKSRVVAVGDSVAHDIRGASDFGIASMLVRTGVLADASDERLTALFAEDHATPTYLLPQFRW